MVFDRPRVGRHASRHACRAQRHLECGVQMVPSGSRAFSKWRPNFKEPPRTSLPGLRDDYFLE